MWMILIPLDFSLFSTISLSSHALTRTSPAFLTSRRPAVFNCISFSRFTNSTYGPTTGSRYPNLLTSLFSFFPLLPLFFVSFCFFFKNCFLENYFLEFFIRFVRVFFSFFLSTFSSFLLLFMYGFLYLFLMCNSLFIFLSMCGSVLCFPCAVLCSSRCSHTVLCSSVLFKCDSVFFCSAFLVLYSQLCYLSGAFSF